MDLTYAYAGDVVKYEKDSQGNLIVYGKATGTDLDLDGQRCNADWLKSAMPKWFRSGGNVREQHDSKRAVGKAFEHEVTADNDHMIRAVVVDPIAKAKVEAGVLTGFSIGVKGAGISKSVNAPNGEIDRGDVCEVSLVDRPCLPTATLTMCKAAKPGMTIKGGDFDHEKMLVKCEELVEKNSEPDPLQIDLAGDAEDAIKAVQDVSAALDALADKTITADEVEKATDVDDLSAPAPGQTCMTCKGDGHLWCAPEGFDRDAAIALLTDTVEKADAAGGDGSEAADIVGARNAISQIGMLICSEAAELAEKADQSVDIRLLLSAASMLHAFIGREQMEEGANPSPVHTDCDVFLSEHAELTKGKYTAEQLRKMLADGEAIANADGEPSFPIGDKDDLEKAIHAVGRSGIDHDKVIAYIKKRAKALGATDMLPEEWTKTVDPETEKTANATVHVDVTDNGSIAELLAQVTELQKAFDALPGKTTDVVEAPVEKTDEPDVEKAATDAAPMTPDLLVKALTTALEDDGSELRKMFAAIAEASANKTAEALSARLDTVEQMARPNGPNLRQSQEERDNARKGDLQIELAKFEALEQALRSEDPPLAASYASKAAGLRAQLKAL